MSSQLLTAPTPHSSPRLTTMDKEDLRKTLSATQTKFELRYRLRTHPSLTLDIPPFQTSGVDCLINLIQHTNAILDKRSSTQREEQNPLLAYAWQAFFPQTIALPPRKLCSSTSRIAYPTPSHSRTAATAIS
jgi:predicted component of type VI protein secretion system